jgi:hypothetical protein
VTDSSEKKSGPAGRKANKPKSKSSQTKKSVEDYEKATEILQQNILKHSQKSQSKDAEDIDQE